MDDDGFDDDRTDGLPVPVRFDVAIIPALAVAAGSVVLAGFSALLRDLSEAAYSHYLWRLQQEEFRAEAAASIEAAESDLAELITSIYGFEDEDVFEMGDE